MSDSILSEASSSSSSAATGNCASCGGPAATRCADCKLVFYCTKEHQRSHWPSHKSACRAYEVRDNEELGRHLVATRDLDADDLILSELPIVWGPSYHAESSVCVGCGIKDVFMRCPGCKWPACKITCPGLADDERHKFECKILAAARLLPRCENLLILRALILQRRNPKRWKTLTKLESHEEKRGPGTDAYEEMRLVAEYFGPMLALDAGASEVLAKVCGLVDVNALETNPPEGSAAIYEVACLLEHRCIANTRHTFVVDEHGRPRIKVIAVKPIKKGEHLSTTYTHALWSTRSRREHLRATKYFACKCERCSDRTELGSHMGSLKCPCGNGWMTPEEPLAENSEWSCDKCPGVLSTKEVAQLFDRLGEEVEAAMSGPDTEILTDLLFRLEVLLHPCHQHCITVSHTLLQMLEPDDPKKAELCQRMIDLFEIVDPYGARLAIYQVIALRELSLCPDQDRKALLTRAMEILRYEPPKSPGAVLSNIILQEV
ncbi:protein msta-like [Copidosoma floridanum]|uniref:protein msta-like n=1 Tax=Copidosoma floridanum TaxID=29053 RepID=UPI0006C9AF17|nr:protein msta-like [Copidosoma floridanum]